MFALALEFDDFLLRQQLIAAIRGHLVQFLEPLHRLLNGHPVGQQTTQPTLVDVEHSAAPCLFGNGFLRLPLGSDEEHEPAVGGEFLHELRRFLEHLQRLLQVDDVNPVALAEDILLHLRIPALRLMPEVNSGFEQLFHGDISQVTSLLDCILQLPAASQSGRRLATTTQPLLLQLPAPRDYIPVPAPLRTEQRVREDLGPGNRIVHRAAGTRQRGNQRGRSQKSCQTQRNDARYWRTPHTEISAGKTPLIQANRPGRKAPLQRTRRDRAKPAALALGELEPLTGTLLSVLLALFLTRIASHESFGLQLGAQLRIKLL